MTISLTCLDNVVLGFTCPGSDHAEAAKYFDPQVHVLWVLPHSQLLSGFHFSGVSCGFCFSGVTWEVVDVEDIKQEVYDRKLPELSTSANAELGKHVRADGLLTIKAGQ